MVVVGRLVGTFEPARVMVTIAQANSANARANTIAPRPPAGTAAGMNGKGMSQLSASPPSTATAHAIGGRIMTFAVSVASAMAGIESLACLADLKTTRRCSISGSCYFLCHLNIRWLSDRVVKLLPHFIPDPTILHADESPHADWIFERTLLLRQVLRVS